MSKFLGLFFYRSESVVMVLHKFFQKMWADQTLTGWLQSVVIVAMLACASAKAAAYEFVANENPYNIADFTTANNNTIPTLVAGFTIKNKATVNWNFDGKTTAITGPIVVEEGGALNITAHGKMKSEGSVTVNGTLIIANSDIDSIGLKVKKTSFAIGSTGTLIIANSGTDTLGLGNDHVAMRVEGMLTIANSDKDSIGLCSRGGSVIVGAKAMLAIANSQGVGLFQKGTLTVGPGVLLPFQTQIEILQASLAAKAV